MKVWSLRTAIVLLMFILSSCYLSSKDIIFSLKGGDEIPFKAGKYTSTCTDKDGVVKVLDGSQRIVVSKSKNGLLYSFYFTEKGKSESGPLMLTFHKVESNIFIAAYSAGLGKGEVINFVKFFDAFSYALLRYDPQVLASIGKAHAVEVTEGRSGEWSLSGTVENQKTFLLAMAKEMPLSLGSGNAKCTFIRKK